MTDDGYRERLVPGWWVWIIALGLVAMIAIAYGAALGATAGWLTAVGGMALAIGLIWTGAPRLGVSAAGVEAAGACLPLWAVGEVRIVGPDEIAALRGPGADARLYAVLRPSAGRAGLLIHVTDDDDPHPAWLLTTRHPDRMAAAITATMDAPERPRLED